MMISENSSKSEQLEQHMLREILPSYQPGDRIPSEQQIAEELGTSRTTMHKVYFNLMGKGLIYRKNGVGTFRAEPPAFPEKQERVRLISAVLPSLNYLNAERPNWFNHQYTLEYFAEAAERDNYILNVLFLDHDRHTPAEAERLLSRADVSAFLFPAMVVEHAPMIERLTRAGKVCVGRFYEEANFCNSVWFDVLPGFTEAVRHLAATGRKRIALLDFWTPDMPLSTSNGYPIARHLAFREALTQTGVPYIAELCRLCSHHASDGEWAVRRMLEEKLRFDAILCGTDQRAFGALAALRKSGVRVPEDVAVIGLNNESRCAECDPPLASIEGSYRIMGNRLYELAADLLTRPVTERFESRSIPTRFQWRESAG